MKVRTAASVALFAGLLAGCGGGGGGSTSTPPASGTTIARAGSTALVRVESGLLIDDAFRAPVTRADIEKTYELNGSAVPAHRRFRADANGLHVGVTRHAPGLFEGFFAVTHAAYPASSIFHTRMSRLPGKAVVNPKESGEAVFAVQTGNTKKTGLINYVLVATFTSSGLFHELIGYAHGKIAGATTKVLWESPYAPTRPDTFDIDLRTDGKHSLEVWLNGKRAYSATNLDMNIQPPFQPYLEVQGLGIPYESTFQDFWVAGDDTLTVGGLKPGARLTLTRDAGSPVTATAAPDGTAELELGVDAARGRGTLKVDGVADALGPFDFAGGDVLRVQGG